MIVAGAGYMRGHLADLKVEGQKVFGILHDLTAGDHGAGDVLQGGYAAVLEELIHRFPELPEITGAAAGACADAADPSGVHGFGPLIKRMANAAPIRHEDRFESCGTDIDTEVQFFHNAAGFLPVENSKYTSFHYILYTGKRKNARPFVKKLGRNMQNLSRMLHFQPFVIL